MTLGTVQLTPQLIQAVRDAVDVVDIVGEATPLKKAGRRYKGLCPFHKEKTPSFTVDPDSGLYYCFGCGAGGDAIKFFMEQSGDDFPAAIEALARRYGIPLPAARRAPGRSGAERRDLNSVLEAAADFFTRELERSEFARNYLQDRRIRQDLITRYRLGYAPDGWRNLLAALRNQMRLEDLIAAGLVGRSQRDEPYDRFRHRLMFPIHAPNGRLVGFGGRTLGDDRAKYINTAETEEFHKGRLLYGFHQAKRELRDKSRAILVEGYFDVLGIAASGLGGAVAGMGTSLTNEQAKLLGRYVDDVVVAYDGDDAGEKACQRALPILLSEDLAVRRARFPAGHDPDSLRLEEGPEAVVRTIEEAADAVWLEIEKQMPEDRSPAGRTRAAKGMAELLRTVRDPMTRGDYVRRAAQNLGVPEEALLNKVGSKLFFDSARQERTVDTQPAEGELRALHHLLHATDLPEELPPEEIFLDEDCRNIYAIFRAIHSEGHRAPTPDSVLQRLSSEGRAIDRLARILLQEIDSGAITLEETLSPMVDRWRKERRRDLDRRMKEAQERGDQELIMQLLEELKDLLSRRHPNMHGRFY